MAKHKWEKKCCLKASEYNNSAVRGLRLLQKHWHFQWNAWGDTRCNGFDKKPHNSGGRMWHSYVTVWSKTRSQLFCSDFSPLSPSSSHLSPLFNYTFSISLCPLSFSVILPIDTCVTSSSPPLLPPSSALPILTQLYQLRRRMSATAIMPSKGTTDDQERDWTESRGAWLGGWATWRKELSFRGAWPKNWQTDRTQWNPSMRHFVLFRIKPQRGGTT